MATTSFQGIIRSYGGQDKSSGVTPSNVILSAIISFNPVGASAVAVRVGTSATSGEIFKLPKGAVPTQFISLGGATGGTNPTVDIGTAADPDGFFNELDADLKGAVKGADGALAIGTGVPANVQVTANEGSSAATGGTVTGTFHYTMVDNARAGESQPELVSA
jgi:hypothetical protein